MSVTPFGSEDPSTTVLVPISFLKASGTNPRLIKDKRFKQLIVSLERNPEFLWDRPVLARPDGSIYAGEMRYRGACELGWTHMPARINEHEESQYRTLGLLDNLHHGDWQEEELEDDLRYLQQEGMRLDHLPFSGDHLESLINDLDGSSYDDEDTSYDNQSSNTNKSHNPDSIRCPKCGHEWEQ